MLWNCCIVDCWTKANNKNIQIFNLYSQFSMKHKTALAINKIKTEFMRPMEDHLRDCNYRNQTIIPQQMRWVMMSHDLHLLLLIYRHIHSGFVLSSQLCDFSSYIDHFKSWKLMSFVSLHQSYMCNIRVICGWHDDAIDQTLPDDSLPNSEDLHWSFVTFSLHLFLRDVSLIILIFIPQRHKTLLF